MCNIISGRDYANKWVVSQCCCGCSLRAGTLTIGWLSLIGSILWIVNLVRDKHNYAGVGSVILSALLAIFILVGVYKHKIRLVWAAVYTALIITLWSIVVMILFFVMLLWISGIFAAIGVLLNLYFFLVMRSYAYEAQEAMPTGAPA